MERVKGDVTYQLAHAGNVPSRDHLAKVPVLGRIQERSLQQKVDLDG